MAFILFRHLKALTTVLCKPQFKDILKYNIIYKSALFIFKNNLQIEIFNKT